MQLELEFDKKSDIDIKFDLMAHKIETVKLSSDKVRKGLFARHNETSKMLLDALKRIEELERDVSDLRRRTADSEHEKWLYGTESGLFEAVVG